MVFEAIENEYLVPFDGNFRISAAATHPAAGQHWKSKSRLKTAIERLDDLQRVLHASDSHAVLLVFQGMDSAGKDSTIRAVMRGINPAGCQESSFKKPAGVELDHDFLWRTTRSLPARGRIGIFNRSQYEEVLVVRVHPELLTAQRLPGAINLETIWDERLESIRDQEKHLARNGTVIVKFWLNVSRSEQKKRFLRRLDNPDKNWKFKPADIAERAYWDDYMHAYEAALNATSRPWAPWYAVPADNKPHMRACVAEIIVEALSSIGLEYPQASEEDKAGFERARAKLSKHD
ncbi:MAG: PPK2 family polyphosphate kinase [Gammaproteobacteria bacterium]